MEENLRGRAIPSLSARRAWTRLEKKICNSERMRGGGWEERWQRAVNEARCYRVARSWLRQVSTVRRATTFVEQSRHNLRRVRCARLSRGPTGLFFASSSSFSPNASSSTLFLLPSKVQGNYSHLPGNIFSREKRKERKGWEEKMGMRSNGEGIKKKRGFFFLFFEHGFILSRGGACRVAVCQASTIVSIESTVEHALVDRKYRCRAYMIFHDSFIITCSNSIFCFI